MSRKPRRNKSARKPEQEPKRPVPARMRELEQRYQRRDQSIAMQDLRIRYGGNVPVRELWQHRAQHLEMVRA